MAISYRTSERSERVIYEMPRTTSFINIIWFATTLFFVALYIKFVVYKKKRVVYKLVANHID